jgi:hypothetical protein
MYILHNIKQAYNFIIIQNNKTARQKQRAIKLTICLISFLKRIAKILLKSSNNFFLPIGDRFQLAYKKS